MHSSPISYVTKHLSLNTANLQFCFLICLFIITSSAKSQSLIVENIEKGNGEIMIEEGWQFHSGDFLTAGEMIKLDNHKVKIPHIWKNEVENNQDFPPHGYGTYYKRVILSEPRADIGFFAPTTSTNYALYINGKLTGRKGKLSTKAETSEGEYKTEIYALPFLADTLDIIYHISNFDYRIGGMWKAPAIGTVINLERAENKRYFMQFFLLGAIMMLCLYHIGVNIPQFRNKESLYFALLCLTAILRIGATDDYLIVSYIPGFPWELYVKTEFISYYMMVGISALFVLAVFKDLKLPKKPFHAIFYVFSALSVITLFSTVNFASYLIPIAELLTVVSLLIGFFYLAKPISKGDPEAIVFLAGTTAVVLALMNFALELTSPPVINFILSLGIFIFFFCCSVVIARRLGNAFSKLEYTKDALSQLNSNLEKKIEARTIELHANNQELNVKNEELKIANIELGILMTENDGLISVVAHDLKSPLIRNLSLIDLIKMDGEVNTTQRECLQLIYKNNQNGLDLISDLLQEYSTQSSFQPKNETFDINQLCNEFLNGFKISAERKQIKVIPYFPKENTVFTSDLMVITRILENLFSNAIKFSEKNKKVWLKMAVENQNLIITCKDEGPGISEKEQKLLFKRFQRLSNLPTAGESSTGLGLSIVKKLVNNLQGEIVVFSQPSFGTSFTVILPSGKKPFSLK